MMFFKKNHGKVVGKGADKTISLNKEFDVYNYTPVDYAYTEQYADFLVSAEKHFKAMLNKVSVDEYNDEMFDSYIDSITDEMKNSARSQYTYHVHVIHHHKGLIEGVIKKANAHRKNLTDDLHEINCDIEKYEKLKDTLKG